MYVFKTILVCNVEIGHNSTAEDSHISMSLKSNSQAVSRLGVGTLQHLPTAVHKAILLQAQDQLLIQVNKVPAVLLGPAG